MEDSWHARKPYEKPRKVEIDVHGYNRVTPIGRVRILQHRFIMEQYLGRALFDNELVHHKNGVKTDNRIENLEIVSRRDHINMHRSQVRRTYAAKA